MYKVVRTRKRLAVKEVQISMDLRRRIVDGELPPGSQLPKRVDLEQRFSVSPVTVQKAVDRLIEEGFVYAKTGLGTFVVDKPPHLSRYGLVFPSHPGDRMWTTFYKALNNEAQVMHRDEPHKLSVYQGLELPERLDDREKLIEEVLSHRLAGLIFVFNPQNFSNTPLLDEPRMARVALMDESKFGVPAIRFDGRWAKALDHFVERGRKRVAIMFSPTMRNTDLDSFRGQLAERGLTSHNYWQHAVHPSAAEAARNIVHLMCLPSNEQRPDALFITDDNLVPHATAGLLAAGVHVPEQMDVVAHANFPYPTASVVPARRLGFDVRQVLEESLACIDRQRQGDECAEVKTVCAVFEDEIGAANR